MYTDRLLERNHNGDCLADKRVDWYHQSDLGYPYSLDIRTFWGQIYRWGSTTHRRMSLELLQDIWLKQSCMIDGLKFPNDPHYNYGDGSTEQYIYGIIARKRRGWGLHKSLMNEIRHVVNGRPPWCGWFHCCPKLPKAYVEYFKHRHLWMHASSGSGSSLKCIYWNP